MFSTKHGPFDGDSWESLMQICFRIKYELEHYQHMPASPGDYGIEGFTRTGKVFQCYCPETDIPFDELYEKQRDKITQDLKKLSIYEHQLKGYLKDIKIKEWIFVTPKYKKKELVKHCRDKAEEVKAAGLSIIDPSFDVIIHDIDHFPQEIPIALNGDGKKLFLTPDEAVEDDKIVKWKETSIDFVDNALRKHTKRFPTGYAKAEEKANILTHNTIRDFLNGESVLRRWQQIHPENYDRFLVLVDQIEAEVKEQCMFPVNDNNELYNQIKDTVHARIKTSFNYLDEVSVTHLTKRMLAYWLIRCPLDFE